MPLLGSRCFLLALMLTGLVKAVAPTVVDSTSGDLDSNIISRANPAAHGLPVSLEGRILRVASLLFRGVRWSLKKIKSTYESWHIEMDYAKCLTTNYDIKLSIFSPPWSGRSLRRRRSPFPDSATTAGLRPRAHTFVPARAPYLYVADTLFLKGSEALIAAQTDVDFQLAMKIWYDLFSILWNQVISVFSRLRGPGVVKCTRKYLKKQFWRWIDRTPIK